MSVTGTVQAVGNSSQSPTPPSQDIYAVLYVPQNLSPSQKLQAIQNIGALVSTDLNGLVDNVSYDNTTNQLTISVVNGTPVMLDLSQNNGVSNIGLDTNNDLVISYLNGSTNILSISNLFTNFIESVNNKTGKHITIDIADIQNLTQELAARVPLGRRIEIDGDVKDLNTDAVFNTTNVKFTAQSLSAQQQQIARNNIDTLSPAEVSQLIATEVPIAIQNIPPKSKGLLVHTLTNNDVAQATITLTTANVADITDDYSLYVNGQYINDDDYLVQNDKVIIAKSNIEFEVVVGMKVTFKYRY